MRCEKVMIRQLPYEFVCDYKEDEHLRESFFKLAREVFNIDFKPWYEMGEWQEKYIPFSIVAKGEVVANASANLCYFKRGEKSVCYVQIGTVMTRADHRQKGLAAFLINKIIETYKEEQDNIYLYANDTVLNFYPKFGFSKIDRYEFYKQVNKAYLSEEKQLTFRQLDHRKLEDRSLLVKKIKEGASEEEALSVTDNESLLMFYFQSFMSQCFYYVQEADSIVVMSQEENKMIIHEVYGKLSLMRLEEALLNKDISEIVLGFMPKASHFEVRRSEDEDTTLFVLDANEYHAFAGEHGCFPAMSYA